MVTSTSSSPTLLLVGPGKHFGLDILRRFAKEGFRLAVISRTAATLERVRADLAQDGIETAGATADVTRPEDFSAAVRTVAAQFGGLTCLIYHPKAGPRGTGLELAAGDLAATLAVNATGAMVAVQAAAPYMSAGSTVILTGGGFKDTPDSSRLALSVGKGALHTLALALAAPLQEHGIAIKTIVIDGSVRTGGPIEPDLLADYYWTAFSAPSGLSFHFPEPLE